ncbi:DUF3551 domain-containing protein [Bradyrhizobium sp. HKCCYLS1011]|uniref:DUF3551 domain-containing protein n=1 Tax=Bradyrhizobium sp. HKCCYLS1011 TaxID=3420733 RepID=UPI003EB95410
MSKMITFSAIAAALAAATIFAQPAAAKDYEYCRQDYSGGTRVCSFDTAEQCLSTVAGRGGSCFRNPFLGDTSAVRTVLAYAPKARVRSHRHHAD